MKAFLLYLGYLLTGAALMAPATAQTETDVRKKQFNVQNGLAIDGYDPVAYFTQQKAVKGQAANAHVHEGITYYFVSKENREAFRRAPAKYEPQYGGWCAYAMGESGEKVEIDPETFKVLGGKLYLFYNKFFNNTLPKWNKDEANLKRKADASWLKFYKPAKV